MTIHNDFFQKVKSEIFASLGSLRQSTNGWQTQNCKLCHHRGHSHDKRNRFGILVPEEHTIGVHCFNCGFSSQWNLGEPMSKSFQWFMTTIGIGEINVKRIAFEAYKLKYEIESDTPYRVEKDPREQWLPIDLPPDTNTISEWARQGCTDPLFLNAIEYLNSRNLLDPDVFCWSKCTTNTMNRRVILPFYYNGNIVGYTARYVGEPKNKMVPKYVNKTPPDFIYNYDQQNRKYTILAEGVFDAYMVNGISCFGKEVSKVQQSLINKLPSTIITVPDRDRDGDVLFNTAKDMAWHISIPRWEKGIKDIAQAVSVYGRVMTLKSIIAEADSSAFATSLKRKLDKF